MKIFYSGPRRSNELSYVNKAIVEFLESKGHKIDKSLIETAYEYDVYHFEEAYKRNLKSINSCDLMVIEITEASTSSGFVISYALNQHKPVLALINTSQTKSVPTSLKGSTNKLFTLKEYDSKTLEKVLGSYITSVKSIIDTKFILIISPEIDRYLQWASESRRMHKAQVVRLALEDVMEKDKEYKDHVRKS